MLWQPGPSLLLFWDRVYSPGGRWWLRNLVAAGRQGLEPDVAAALLRQGRAESKTSPRRRRQTASTANFRF
jgi:hypothetical protein